MLTTQSIANQALYAGETEELIDANCRGNFVETTMRLRALTELSRLDTDELLALVHMVLEASDDERREALGA